MLNHLVPQELSHKFSSTNKECIQRLYENTSEHHNLSDYPKNKLGAVLILLYEEDGELRVLLTTRSKTLRTHPGQTALPGGRVDEVDKNFIETAYREANEEVGLPRNSPDIHFVTTLEPFVSLHKIVVTPIVAILTRPSIIEELRAQASEVAHIFTHPLRAILDPTIAKGEPLAQKDTENWPYEQDLHSTTDSAVPILDNAMYRMHRFRSSASPIKGLTADILIKAAQITFGIDPSYDRYAPGQPRTFGEMSRFATQ